MIWGLEREVLNEGSLGLFFLCWLLVRWIGDIYLFIGYWGKLYMEGYIVF